MPGIVLECASHERYRARDTTRLELPAHSARALQGMMLDRDDALRGWSADGVSTRERLLALGL